MGRQEDARLLLMWKPFKGTGLTRRGGIRRLGQTADLMGRQEDARFFLMWKPFKGTGLSRRWRNQETGIDMYTLLILTKK